MSLYSNTFFREKERYEAGKKGRGWYKDGTWIAYRPMYMTHLHSVSVKKGELYLPSQKWYQKILNLFRRPKLKWRTVIKYDKQNDGMAEGKTKREAYLNLKKKVMAGCPI